MTISDKQTFRVKKKAVLVSVDDKALLLDTAQNVFYFLSEAAISLLRALRKPRGASFGALKARFALEQKASGDKSASEVSGFLKQLADCDLLPTAEKDLLAKAKARGTIAVIMPGGDLISLGSPIVPKPPPPPPPPVAYYIQIGKNLVALVLPLPCEEEGTEMGTPIVPKPPPPPPPPK
jgi:hypothetical protein